MTAHHRPAEDPLHGPLRVSTGGIAVSIQPVCFSGSLISPGQLLMRVHFLRGLARCTQQTCRKEGKDCLRPWAGVRVGGKTGCHGASPAWVLGLCSRLTSLTSHSWLSSLSFGYCPHLCDEAALARLGSYLRVVGYRAGFCPRLLDTWAAFGMPVVFRGTTPFFSMTPYSRACISRLFFWLLCGLLLSLKW